MCMLTMSMTMMAEFWVIAEQIRTPQATQYAVMNIPAIPMMVQVELRLITAQTKMHQVM